jgi:hypothetical protein
MVKLIFLFKRRQGTTVEQFREYYEKRHTALALRLLPFFKDYRRNYIRHDLNFDAGAGTHNPLPDFDVMTEVTFESRSAYDRMAKTMGDPSISEQIFGDEERFMDRSASVFFFVDEEVTPHHELTGLASTGANTP